MPGYDPVRDLFGPGRAEESQGAHVDDDRGTHEARPPSPPRTISRSPSVLSMLNAHPVEVRRRSSPSEYGPRSAPAHTAAPEEADPPIYRTDRSPSLTNLLNGAQSGPLADASRPRSPSNSSHNSSYTLPPASTGSPSQTSTSPQNEKPRLSWFGTPGSQAVPLSSVSHAQSIPPLPSPSHTFAVPSVPAHRSPEARKSGLPALPARPSDGGAGVLTTVEQDLIIPRPPTSQAQYLPNEITRSPSPSSAVLEPPFTRHPFEHDRSRPQPSGAAPSPSPPPPLVQRRRYQPVKRVSQPRSVLVPITEAEIAELQRSIKNPLRDWAGPSSLPMTPARSLPNSRGSAGSPPVRPGSGPHSLPPRPSTASYEQTRGPLMSEPTAGKRPREQGNFSEVADHYNKRQEVGLLARKESPIIALKAFNNWIKSVLIGQFVRPRPPQDGRGPGGGRVLDLGCGKGGDLQKWDKARISEYVALDIADISVRQADDRYRTNRRPFGFNAQFHALDCFSKPLTDALDKRTLSPMFDNVTLQFCMHYAFDSVQRARQMLENVAMYLRSGGVFIGTIPDADNILGRLRALPGDELTFGNSVYHLTFDQKDKFPPYGHRYRFFLEDAVDDVPEFVVNWDQFEGLAAELGLHCIYKKPFADMFRDERRTPEFGALLDHMNVVDRSGRCRMSDEQWEAATIYLGFAFEKR